MAVVGKIWAPWNQSSPKCPYSPKTMPLFTVLLVHILRYLVWYIGLGDSRRFQKEHFGTACGKYEAYLPEIAVHKTIDKTSRTKPLAIINVTDTANGGSLSPFAKLSSMFYFLLYFTSHYPPNWEGTKLHKRYAIKHKGQGKCCLSVNKPLIG